MPCPAPVPVDLGEPALKLARGPPDSSGRARSTLRPASEIQRGKRVLHRAVIPAKMPASMRMHINQTRIISTRPLLKIGQPPRPSL
jgi:hypothetical protein